MLLKIAGIANSTYHYVLKHMNDKENKDKALKSIVMKIFKDNYEKYGVPRITQELRNIGFNVNKKRVERIMKELGIKARPQSNKYRSYKGEIGKICKNQLLEKEEKNGKIFEVRNFETTRPYEKLGTDVTVFITKFGKLYLSPIIDFHTREILSYCLSENPNYAQVRNMLNNMFEMYGDKIKGTILHSDQGFQYQLPIYQKTLIEHDIIQSMSRKGNCLDNSPTENFFGRMKEEMYYGKEDSYKSLEELQSAIIKYIKYYNEKRIVNRLGLSPVQYRQKYFSQL
ncbi:MAG: IS3 family transposase [Anaeroplasma sp.]